GALNVNYAIGQTGTINLGSTNGTLSGAAISYTSQGVMSFTGPNLGSWGILTGSSPGLHSGDSNTGMPGYLFICSVTSINNNRDGRNASIYFTTSGVIGGGGKVIANGDNNQVGSPITIGGGFGCGTGNGGSVFLAASLPSGSSGSTRNSLTNI